MNSVSYTHLATKGGKGRFALGPGQAPKSKVGEVNLVGVPLCSRSHLANRSHLGVGGHVAAFSRQTGRVQELTDQERSSRLKALNALLDLMRPAVQADGGDLVLIRADVETGVVEVQLQGACSSCAISSDTLQGGVTRILTDRLDWVTEVIGGVDDSMDPEDSMSLGAGGYVPRYRQL